MAKKAKRKTAPRKVAPGGSRRRREGGITGQGGRKKKAISKVAAGGSGGGREGGITGQAG